MIQMELGSFIENVVLPEGVSFYDFSVGVTVVPIFNGNSYISTKMMRLVKGEKHADIEITRLGIMDGTGTLINVGSFALEIDKAIQQL